jgi:flagellar M-ring protein FliF
LGLPKGSVTGFEMMESNRFGMTQFQERLTFQRGLEGELTRSIQALVVGAKCPRAPGLAQPERVFSRAAKAVGLGAGEPEPWAHAGPRPAGGHCASGGVQRAGDDPSSVSVLDDTGKLLSTPADGDGGMNGGDAQQLQHVQQMEQLYSQPHPGHPGAGGGAQNVKAQVTAEVDFSQTESTSESHKPNQTPDARPVRSQQLVESGAGGGRRAADRCAGCHHQPAARPVGCAINGPAQALARRGLQRAAGSAAGGASASPSSTTRWTRRCGWCGAAPA